MSISMSVGGPLLQRCICTAVRHWGSLVSHACSAPHHDLPSYFHLLPSKPGTTNHSPFIKAIEGQNGFTRPSEIHT